MKQSVGYSAVLYRKGLAFWFVVTKLIHFSDFSLWTLIGCYFFRPGQDSIIDTDTVEYDDWQQSNRISFVKHVLQYSSTRTQ